MEVEFPGHVFRLDVNAPKGSNHEQIITFQGKEPGISFPGVTTQEILRVLIDRTWYCDNCLPSHLNDYIVHHLRMALVLHEARALIRKVETGVLKPEFVALDQDGHFKLSDGEADASSYALEPRKRTTDTGGPNPGTVHHCAAALAREKK